MMIFVASLSSFISGVPPALSAQIGLPGPDFALKDQYEHPFQLSETRGKTVLLVYGDRDGNKFMGYWSRPVREKYNSGSREQIRIVPMANLDGVPGLLHGFVGSRFRTKGADGKPQRPILLDWDGIVAKKYGFRRDLTNVYLLDSRGILQFVGAGEGSPENLTALFEAIDRTLQGVASARIQGNDTSQSNNGGSQP